jgi:hypothetical protein
MVSCEVCLRPCSEDEGMCDSCFEVMPMGEWVSPARLLSDVLAQIPDRDLLHSIRMNSVLLLPNYLLTRDMGYYERDSILRREARRRNLL